MALDPYLARRPSTSATGTGRTAGTAPARQDGLLEWAAQQPGFEGTLGLLDGENLAYWSDRYANRGSLPLSSDNPGSVAAGGGTTAPASVTDQWNQLAPAAAPAANPLMDALAGRVIGPDGSLAQASVSRDDPTIRSRVDAYSAQQERARRLYLQEAAEAAGPYGHLRGEQRMSAERLGQNVGAFEAELLGREMETRRAELAQYLSVYGSMLSEQQRQQLQTQLALMDAQMQQQRFALDVETQQAYFDAVNRGLFRPE